MIAKVRLKNPFALNELAEPLAVKFSATEPRLPYYVPSTRVAEPSVPGMCVSRVSVFVNVGFFGFQF